MATQTEVLIGRVVGVIRLRRVLGIHDGAVVRVAGGAGGVSTARTRAKRDVVTVHARDTHVRTDRNRKYVVGVRSLDSRGPTVGRMAVLASRRKHIVTRVRASVVVTLMTIHALVWCARVNGRHIAVARDALRREVHADEGPFVHERRRTKTHRRVACRAVHREAILMDGRFDRIVVVEVATYALARSACVYRRRTNMTRIAGNRCVRVLEWPFVYEGRRTERRC